VCSPRLEVLTPCRKTHPQETSGSAACASLASGGEGSAASASASSASSASGPPPGPLPEGEYGWEPAAPCRVFGSRFAPEDDAPAHEVSRLRLTRFLGSGASGTVYEASYDVGGEARFCAVKFAGSFPDHSPDSHAAIDLLARPRKSPSPGYEGEKRALQLLRPRSEAQWQERACGPVRLMQFLGFQDACEALLLELCEGGHPEPDPALMASVEAFLKRIEHETNVEVGDLKFDNIMKDDKGTATVIDLGLCQYTGGATCGICNARVESEVDAHAQEHVGEFVRARRGPVSRLRLQEFCYGEAFC